MHGKKLLSRAQMYVKMRDIHRCGKASATAYAPLQGTPASSWTQRVGQGALPGSHGLEVSGYCFCDPPGCDCLLWERAQ